jgi:hypothetical protein
MADEKSSMFWPENAKDKYIPAPVASQATCPYRPSSQPRQVKFRVLARLIFLSTFLFTLYIWGCDKFHRFTGGEDLWVVNAFVRQGHGKHEKGGLLRGKAAEKLYL